MNTFLKTSPYAISIISISLSSIIFFCFILFCFIYIPSRTLSTSSQDLGEYGDFIGGVVGTLVSLATLGVTIYLAITLHKLEKENATTSISTQKNIAVMQMKFQELSLFKSTCDNAFSVWGNIAGNIEDAIKADQSIEFAFQRIQTMFPEITLKKFPEFVSIGFRASNNTVLNRSFKSEVENPESTLDMDAALIAMYDNLALAQGDYFNLVRKLSAWALEYRE